ncbi:MAG: ComEC/Rec2 family competence protein [Clostridia bacterium]|nr:ComEC/Rec2 family competence protein [Clostridia bacterium]
MTRSLAVCGASFLFGCLMACVLGTSGFCFIGMGVALCLAGISFAVSKARNISTDVITAALGFCGLALLFCALRFGLYVENNHSFADGRTYTVYGTVEDISYYSTSEKLKLRALKITDENGKETDCDFLFSSRETLLTHVDIGDMYSVEAVFSPIKAELGGDFTDGISLSAKTEYFSAYENENFHPGRFLSNIRRYFEKRLYCCFDSLTAEFTDALLLGNDRFLPRDIDSDFSLSGAGHILVVSGMHLASAAAFLGLFLGLFPISKRPVYLLQLIFVFAFMLVTGFSTSVMRAGIMFFICTLGKMFGYRYDALTSIFTAAFLILLANPFAVFGYSFIYSFLAVFGIEMFASSVFEFLSKPMDINGIPGFLKDGYKALVSLISVGIAANVMIMPITLLNGGASSFVAILSGCVLSLPSSIIIYCGLIFAVIPASFHFLIIPTRIISLIISGFMMDYCKWASNINFGSVSLLGSCTAAAVTLVLTASLFFLRKNRGIAAVFCMAILLGASVCEYFSVNNGKYVVICPSEKGYSVALVENREADIFSTDNYSYFSMKNELKKLSCNTVNSITLRKNMNSSKWINLSENILRAEKPVEYTDFNGIKLGIRFEKRYTEFDDMDIFICSDTDEENSADFTIIAESDIIPKDLENAASGNYILTENGESIIIRLENNGSLRFMR